MTTTPITQAIEKVDAALDCEPCGNCAGNGSVYADGRAHYMSEGAPTRACPSCGGEGRIFDKESVSHLVREVAKVAQERMRERIMPYVADPSILEEIAALPLELGDDDD